MTNLMKTILKSTLLVALLNLAGCGGKDDAAAVEAKLAGQNLLLITVDTTRADRIGAYGYKPAKTPTIDAIAARGTLFENAFAQVPLTLPSHCSMMTGRYPREHGVRDNGRNALGTSLPTLAEKFKEHGYVTAAFIASFVLDSKFGAARGFDDYHDEMDQVSFESQPLEWQQPAEVVADRAMAWLPTVKDKPFFAWVHFYDAHQPYAPPAEFGGPDILPYDAELTYIDSQIKRITDWLDAAGLTGKTLVLIVGDHGEAFEEHGESGHSNYVYDENIHVPMLFAHPTFIPKGRRIPSLVQVVDLFPTILQLYGWNPPEGLLSRSLARAFTDGKLDDADIYAESLFVFYSFNWAEQRTWITPRWKYISTTKPELYDRQNDPFERENLIEKEPRTAEKVLKQLRERYEAMIPGKAGEADLDPETIKAMEAMGYVGGKTTAVEQFLTEGLPDPKDHVMTLVKLKGAKGMLEKAKSPDEAKFVIPLLRHVVRESPKSQMFHFLLGMACTKADENELALQSFKNAADLDPSNAQAFSYLADTLMKLGRIPEAIKHFEIALGLDPRSADSNFRYAEALNMTGRSEEAVGFYKKALESFPEYAMVHIRLGQALKQLNRPTEAVASFETGERLLLDALANRPNDIESRFRLGTVYLNTERYSQAVESFRSVLTANANHSLAMIFLATALDAQGQLEEAEALARKATTFKETAGEAWHGLGTLLNKRGRTQEAVAAYEQAIAAQPTRRSAIQELVGFYLANRRIADAVRILRVGADNATDNPVFQNMTAKILATSPDDRIRDGKAALVYALRANDLTGGKDPSVLATVAAAHAELGDFTKAGEVASAALDLAKSSSPPELASAIQAQIAGYRSSLPYRDQRF